MAKFKKPIPAVLKKKQASPASKTADAYYMRNGIKTLRPTHYTQVANGVWAHVPLISEYPDGDNYSENPADSE